MADCIPLVIVDIPPPTQVLTLVFLTWAAGTAVFAVVTRLWSVVEAGHYKVIWLVSAGLALAAGFGYRPAWILAGLSVLNFIALYRRIVLVSVTPAVAVAVLGFGTVAINSSAIPQAIAAAALFGTVTNAMLLGHWHLNQPRLGTKPIAGLVWMLWASLAVFIAAMLLLLPGNEGVDFAAWTAIAFTAFAGVLTAMVHHLVKTRSIMSATGILYLEILLVFVSAFTGSLSALARG